MSHGLRYSISDTELAHLHIWCERMDLSGDPHYATLATALAELKNLRAELAATAALAAKIEQGAEELRRQVASFNTSLNKLRVTMGLPQVKPQGE